MLNTGYGTLLVQLCATWTRVIGQTTLHPIQNLSGGG